MSSKGHDEFLLGAYALDLLDHEDVDRAQAHLVGCGDCRTEYEQLVATREALGRIPSEWLAAGPPPGRTALEGALETIRASKAASGRRTRRAFTLAASLSGLVGTFGAGLVMGYQIQPTATTPPAPTVSAPVSAPVIAGVRQASVVDPVTNVSMTATVTPVFAWVRVRVSVRGVPAGEDCLLVVVRPDGTREIAGGWITSRRGETEATVLDGSASVAPGEVSAVRVESKTGRVFVSVRF